MYISYFTDALVDSHRQGVVITDDYFNQYIINI